MKRSARLARIISWIGHPLIFVTVTVATVVSTQLASRTAVTILTAFILSVIGPTAVLLVLGLHSGRWRDADVSVREERKHFYPVAIPLCALGKKLRIDNFQGEACPVVFWDVFAEQGHPVRATVSEMGPLLLGRSLELNDTQEGVLNMVFRIADESGMLLLDLKDLRSMFAICGRQLRPV